MPVVRLAADFVGKIHDELVEMYFPGVEPVSARDHRDRGALEAALGAPFAIAFGEEAFPSMQEKAARLFYGIAANHPFSNGNKRTALIRPMRSAMPTASISLWAGAVRFGRRGWLHPTTRKV